MSQEINCDWLKKWNQYTPEKVALRDEQKNREYTYGDFYRIANGLSASLKSLGIGPGDRVALFSQNRVESVFLFFALQRLGGILVPVNFRLAPQETDFVLRDSGAKLLFIDQEFSQLSDQLSTPIQKRSMLELAGACEEALQNESEQEFLGEFDKPCKILYTSGTTGFPKGVVITPKILYWNSINTTMSLNITSDDVTVNFSPFFHTGGWNVLLTPFIHRGAKVVLLPRFDAEQVLDIIEKEKVSLFFGVPTTLNMMAQEESFPQRDFSQIRYAIVGGEPMPLNMIRLWHKKGVSIRQGFGLTECGPNCFSLSEKDAESKMGSIGRPNFYVDTRIVDSNNEDVVSGEVGELLLKGPMAMTEYWNNDQASKDAFYQGWLRTGDLVRKDDDDYFYVVGRKKEMFISGGENIYPAEVEKVLNNHPLVNESAVVGVEDPQWGEVGHAFVVLNKKQTVAPDEIIQYCRNYLARYKVPKHLSFLEALPKGDSGKIAKKELRNQIVQNTELRSSQ